MYFLCSNREGYIFRNIETYWKLYNTNSGWLMYIPEHNTA